MSFSKRLLAGLLLGIMLWPDARTILSVMKMSNPCGKVVCCCPEMCKMKTPAAAASCHRSGPMDCGLRAEASSPTSLSLEGTADVRIAWITEASLRKPLTTSWIFNLSTPTYTSHTLSPQEKPPQVIA